MSYSETQESALQEALDDAIQMLTQAKGMTEGAKTLISPRDGVTMIKGTIARAIERLEEALESDS